MLQSVAFSGGKGSCWRFMVTFAYIIYNAGGTGNTLRRIVSFFLKKPMGRHQIGLYAGLAVDRTPGNGYNDMDGWGGRGSMLDILIVEDNKEIATLLCDFLRKENYVVSVADTGEKAMELYEKYGAKLIVLDIMLSGMDGFAVCSKIRETSNTHILIASAKTEKNDKLKGLDLGADDYIEKPYDIDILLAKIRGIFKRKYAVEELVEGNLRLNTVNQTLFVDGKKAEVTEKEFELLKLLIENKNVTLKKEYLFRTIWGSDSDSELQTLTVHIKWLREKIEEDPRNPRHIITKWGVGYRFE